MIWSIQRILFIHTTWMFFFLNILIAWIPSLSLILLVIRDSWVIWVIILLLKKNRSITLLFIFSMVALGAVGFLNKLDLNIITGFFYGFRDIMLIVVISELLSGNYIQGIETIEIDRFVNVIIWLAITDIILRIIFKIEIIDKIFNLEDYYRNKGIEISLGFGILGNRQSNPLYSPNLLCTLLSSYFFFDRRINHSGRRRLPALIVSIFTVSKVILVSIFFFLFNKNWKRMLLLSAILIIPLLAFIIVSVDKIESDFIRYHISSIIGHSKALLKAFVIATNSFIPDTLGSNSIATQVIAGTKNGLGIESTLLARFADYKYFFSFILVYIVYSYKRINVDIKKKFYIYFLLLLLFSSASNHPIVYLPTVYLLNNICKSNNFVT